jgi:uncharacterized protein (DUF58 family)
LIPNEIIRQIKRIEIRSRFLVNSLFSGNYQSVFKGRGLEFDGIRQYIRGDDYRSIDWKVSARTGEPHIKTFNEERQLVIQLLFDLSGSMGFGTRNKRKRTLAAEFAATIAFSAVANNDQVGLVLFSDGLEKVVPKGKGRMNALRILREILYTEPKGKQTDLTVPLQFLMQSQRQKCVVFLITDFLNPDLPKLLRSASKRHDIIPVILRDPLEESLPDAGILELRDFESGEVIVVDSSNPNIRERYETLCQERDEKLLNGFKSMQLEPINLSTDKPHEKSLISFFQRREQRFSRRG